MNSKIKVLVVDDSLVFREVLARGISSDPNIVVVAKAEDAFDARDKILKYEPDVMTCDVEMPKLNGIEFIRRLLPQYPLPVIVVSSVSYAVFDAMNVGAVDFVTKPNINCSRGIEEFIYELIQKVKIVSRANINPNAEVNKFNFISGDSVDTTKIIAIGASTGGTDAIYNILKSMPPTTPGIVVVQHIPPIFSKMFAERLKNKTKLMVKEAENGDYIEPGKVLIAPGDRHMKVKKQGDRYKVEVFSGEKINGHCPAVDVLFESVGKEVGSNAIGIILTGMGYDGARGLLSMRRKGARTIGQDQQSSVVYGMPKVANDIGAVEKQVSLHDIPKILYSMINKI
ncbi:protein-glutamate methylesterase/protein-glutamine glutaminase [Serpentinicella alkaliphila]|uniref:Protein-glutamate methylesterase/protein-glutamine glutaminase n=1 Tax=Serpentinicella alkaliphila TaxID=1734049 RepID=A0A4R2T925_9FIRM|nr:chemotaxis response regulator protein-glutamate methylesterase [Serpentinicella alkaliphila]QUH25573.1 chemotaxis response regulator protein-glutamate methylesterase [Serpentinicella alkaliphila]TCP97374.1 two-component system chemotaxis response regulator CheB [Serpentinicella alkaliphila]